MADRVKTARWRRHNDHPPKYRLRRCGIDVACAEHRNGFWFWYSLERPDGLKIVNTSKHPVGTFDEVKKQAKEWLAGNA